METTTKPRPDRKPHTRRRLENALRALAIAAEASEFDDPVTIAGMTDDQLRQQIARLAGILCGTTVTAATAPAPIPTPAVQIENYRRTPDALIKSSPRHRP